MKCIVISMILLIICQYFLNQITVDARPTKAKRFSWAFPIYSEQNDETVNDLVKRKGVGWGKRNLIISGNRPFALHENSPQHWLEE